ncbi:branched-subunit amino acid transport protein AzlD [Ereboglobus sp. PH5-5]|nr:branched-subunit amino acid transport protein AzlD [Ereboglobus sp. PH5-10]MDF9832494.1 branched-subunit amino acid transport protein AzlD [Ereboglobus sp. PH5-5]
MLNMTQVIIATFVAAGVTLFTRLVPFLFFRNRPPSPGIAYLQRYIPPMTMVILVAYCLKDVEWHDIARAIPVVVGVVVTAALHFWKRNPLISIFTGTALYMILIRVM